MKRLFKVVCKGVTYGTYSTMDAARKLRGILQRRGKREIVIQITQEDIDPR
jgi:hypothetical protein